MTANGNRMHAIPFPFFRLFHFILTGFATFWHVKRAYRKRALQNRFASLMFLTLPAMGLAVDLIAQELLVVPGDRIRLRTHSAPSDTLIGNLVTIHEDTLIFDRPADSSRSIIPLSEIASLDVSQGYQSYGPPGLTLGGIAGAIIGLAISGVERDFNGDVRAKKPGPVIIGAVVGSILGIAIGEAIKEEIWQSVDLRQGWYFNIR